MKESKESLALIGGLRSLEERQAPASVRRQVAERLEHTLFSTKPEKQLWPVFRFRLAPLSFAMVVVGTTGVLWASVHVARTVWSPKIGSEAPATTAPQVSSKVNASRRKLSRRTSSPTPAVLAPTAVASSNIGPAVQQTAVELPPSSPPPRALATKPALTLHRGAAQTDPAGEHDDTAALPNRPSVAAFEVPSQPSSELTEERAVLDRARSFIRAGNVSAANQALAEHATRFARGRHTEEREALKVFSAGLHSPSEGRAAAFAFHSRYPNSLFWRGIAEELHIQ